jgi:hypothetical protein
MEVALHTTADHLAFEGGKRRSRAAPLVIMHHGAGPPLLHGQTRLGSVDRLDLALFIDSTIACAGGSDPARNFDYRKASLGWFFNYYSIWYEFDP